MYQVEAFYDCKFRGLEDSYNCNDFEEVVDYSHGKLMQGLNVIIENIETGVKKYILSEMYCKFEELEFTGEFIYQYTDFEGVE